MKGRDIVMLGAGYLAGRTQRKRSEGSPAIGGITGTRLNDDQKYYLDKFGDKMRGSSLSTAKDWVYGIGVLTKAQQKALFNAIRKKYYSSRI